MAPLCLGGNVFGWTADETMSFALLDGFVAAGFDFVDTADGYSNLGAGSRGRRKRNRDRQMDDGERTRASA